jgi:hypothetical protein
MQFVPARRSGIDVVAALIVPRTENRVRPQTGQGLPGTLPVKAESSPSNPLQPNSGDSDRTRARTGDLNAYCAGSPPASDPSRITLPVTLFAPQSISRGISVRRGAPSSVGNQRMAERFSPSRGSTLRVCNPSAISGVGRRRKRCESAAFQTPQKACEEYESPDTSKSGSIFLGPVSL